MFVVGALQIAIRLPEAQSLKEKRFILKSLIAQIRNKFNVSVSEIGSQDSWQMATLGVVHAGNDRSYTNKVLDQVLNFAEGIKKIEVVDSHLEFL